MGHASKVDQIKGQSINESLFMNEHKNFDHVVIYKQFELIFWFSLYLQINCLCSSVPPFFSQLVSLL